MYSPYYPNPVNYNKYLYNTWGYPYYSRLINNYRSPVQYPANYFSPEQTKINYKGMHQTGYSRNEKQTNTLQCLYLTPAILGTIFAYLISSANVKRVEARSTVLNSASWTVAIVAYSAISLAGIVYVVLEGHEDSTTSESSELALLWLGLALASAIIYFSAIYTLTYTLFPYSFAGNIVNNDFLTTGFSFFYFSVSNITLLGYGDIVPVSVFSRILVILEVLFGFFVVINGASLLSSFHSRKNKN